MTPLRVRADLAGAICVPSTPVAFDALLGAALALRDGLPPPANARECVPLDIPIARSECGRVYLASHGHCQVETREAEYTNRRFPIPEAQFFGVPKLRRIDIGAGSAKSYRIPRERSHLVDDAMTWWAIGDEVAIRELLTTRIGYLGKRRGVGLGKVARWTVESCETWPGFPVTRDGYPLRSLPLDWPGLASDVERAEQVLTPPYWDNSRREPCAVPSWER